MYTYTLNPTSANQSFQTVVEGHRFDITFKTAMKMLFATVSIDDKVVKTSGRCIEGTWLVPYKSYLPADCGNFMFVTRDEQYPNHNDFNFSCVLVYYTKEEFEEYNKNGS